MKMYAGLDVSDQTTHICVVDSGGAVYAAIWWLAIQMCWLNSLSGIVVVLSRSLWRPDHYRPSSIMA